MAVASPSLVAAAFLALELEAPCAVPVASPFLAEEEVHPCPFLVAVVVVLLDQSQRHQVEEDHEFPSHPGRPDHPVERPRLDLLDYLRSS